ncbi:hypothetical protein [uncultured Microbacterium sp.]|uniref:hypothetical protein n=1 Tax=uncultured Microbacterium sp. TaxID=191216 RepID=UPI00260AEBFE|nr:hypothetical protein [uncultured Microbacterium sp.]
MQSGPGGTGAAGPPGGRGPDSGAEAFSRPPPDEPPPGRVAPISTDDPEFEIVHNPAAR